VLKLLLATVAVLVLAGAAAAAAPASDVPVTGTTRTTECHFDPHAGDRGLTLCRQQIIVVSADGCFGQGYRLYFQDEIDSVRAYRGDVILPGLDGVVLDADYADLIRPHALLLSDSGPHAFSEAFPVEDASCTA
jgi:hypothetical protein